MNIRYPSISVIIPVKNEAAKIRNCLNGIMEQTIPVKEIIVLDSGSTDGTLKILAEYPRVKIIHIKPDEFNHGETRNVGVRNAIGDYVVFTVGDARPVDKYWVENLMKSFEDERVAGVCGQQIVPHHANNNPLQWFRPISKPLITRYEFPDSAAFHNLTPKEQKGICSFDNVAAAYRKKILLQNPFEKTNFAEDMIWAKSVLLKGYALVYNEKARVYHYHLEDPEYKFKRVFTAQYIVFKLFGFLQPVQSLDVKDYLRMIKTLLLEKEIGGLKRRLAWIKYNRQLNHSAVSALREFRKALQNGEAELDKKHVELCGKIFTPPK